jgi:NAD(P)-dependent dehydrogenase (short-subunit alcohol dehydrogenase family)
MQPRLQDKVALVTGAGSGIGAATARRFAEEGALVVLTDIDAAAAANVAAGITAAGGRAEAHHQDVTDESAWAATVADIVQRHGRLDVLVNNAGIVITGNAESSTLEDWRRTQAVNGESVFLGTRAAIAVMKQHGGSIINISSIEGIVGEQNATAYNYSKGGVRIFTKSAALHCAAQGYGIRVNSVHPGYILTQMVEKGIASMPAEQIEAIYARLLGEIPLGAMGEPVDIANGCLFLASDESKYMTGSELVIDGGYTCH